MPSTPWPDRRLIDLFRVEHPIILAPMVGVMDVELAAAVALGGGLASLPAATLDAAQLRAQVEAFRTAGGGKPINLNFFTHTPPVPNNAREAGWRERLAPYYAELGLDPNAPAAAASRAPFSPAMCEVVEEMKAEVVSFHFGLPSPDLLARVKAAGCVVLSSATTVPEARWLAERGVDAIIAQGNEAGGHRGMFLTDDIGTQIGTFALVPQIVDAVDVPVIAAGGVADERGIIAALALGAAGVQIGTAFMCCPESKITPQHRSRLARGADDLTTLTNVMTGRPARGFYNRVMREVGPISSLAPEFPLASVALAPLQAKTRETGEFAVQWAGQAAALGKPVPARERTGQLAADALALMAKLSG